MRLHKPYFAVLFNWNKQKLSTDIVYFHIQNKKNTKFLMHTRLQFIYEKKFLRVYKYLKLGKSSNLYFKPRTATEHLREAEYLVIPDFDLPFDKNSFLEYCSTFKISKPKVAKVCSYCLNVRNKWTTLEDDSIFYKGKRICDYCSKQELVTELQRSNLVVSGGLTKFFQQQAEREGNLEKVLENIVLGTEQDPINNPSSTLFDVIPAKKWKKSVKLKDIKDIKPEICKLLASVGITSLLPI
ncbi:MAG: hypothetical protein ACTSSF_08630 [Candidatus Heimdallarchaeaceae archaeon]